VLVAGVAKRGYKGVTKELLRSRDKKMLLELKVADPKGRSFSGAVASHGYSFVTPVTLLLQLYSTTR